MALVLEANYSKKLGLPGYSSHQYSVTIRTEVSDLAQVESESSRLYRLLQSSVDREIQETGFLPGGPTAAGQLANGHLNGSHGSDIWRCSSKQKELILQIVGENNLPKARVEELSQQLFGVGVKALNRLQASGLITELTKQFLTIEHSTRTAVNGPSPGRRRV
jgi:hypothetical protein